MTRTLAALLLLAASAPSAEKPEFEVATIRPAPPMGAGPVTVGCTGGPGTKDPGLFTCRSMSLSNLVTLAFHIEFYRLSAPDWMTPMSPLFDLSAKIPPNATKEQFEAMLQNLLADRFRLAVHHETREMTLLTLVVAKNGPKFKEAVATPPPAPGVDTTRPADLPARPTLDKDGYPAFTGRPMSTFMNGRARLYQPRMTMQALATRLSHQLRAPVADATGLAGQYEIGLYWVSDAPLRAPPQADVDPGPTLSQALQEQLGLRLESKKGPVDFLGVDHAEKTPADN